MVALLYHIDEIARRIKRDVLWVAFEYSERGSLEKMPRRLRQHRSKIITWLSKRNIRYQECYGVFDGALEEPYRGDVFVDLPLDNSNADFVALEEMLETAGGSSKIEGIVLYALPLKVARKNGRFYREVMNGI